MYKITIQSTGKYDNVTLGRRYILTTKDAVNFVATLFKYECDFSISKFTRLHKGFYCWSSEISDKFWNKLQKRLDKTK